MYKRYICIIMILTFVILSGICVFAAVEPGSGKFKDVLDNDTGAGWYRDEVYILVSRDITDGYPDYTFRPKNNINVDEFITFVVRAVMGKKIATGTSYWASTYIEKAIEFGLIAQNEFSAYNVPINRGQMAKIMAMALAYSNEKDYPYGIYKYKQQIKDFDDIPYNLSDYILKAYNKGIIAGYPDGTFKYANKANRAEAAVMIGRLLDKSKRKIVPSLPDTSTTLLTYQKDYLWGFMSKTGEVKIQPQYDYAYEFSDGMACIQKGNKVGFVDAAGKLVLTANYEDALGFTEELAPVFIGSWDSGKWGYINKSGQKVITEKFDAAYNFVNGLALVRVGDSYSGKWYFINKAGTYALTENNTGFAAAFNFSEGLAAVKVGTKYGYINSTGKLVITSQFDRAESFSEGLAVVEVNGKSGFIDKTGKLVIPAVYTDCKSFSEGLAPVFTNIQGTYRWGYINKAGEMAISAQFDGAKSFSEGLAPVKLKNNTSEKWGFIDWTGKMVIAPAYDWANPLMDGVAKVGVGESWGSIDRSGKAVGWNPSQSNDTATGAGVIDESGVLTSNDGKLQMTLPSGWAVESDLYPEAVLQASNITKKQFAIVLTDEKAQLPVFTTLSQVYDRVRENFVANLKNASVMLVQDIKVNGYNAKQFEVYGEMQDPVFGLLKLNYLITIVDTPEKYHQVVTWTASDLYPASVNEFKQIANSYKA